MQLIKFRHCTDYGHEWIVQLFTGKRWSLMQLSVSWNDYAAWPFIQIKSGTGYTFSLLFWVYKFGVDLDILSRSWSHYFDQEDEGI